ncbi:hypothetical protein IPJ72_01720 [Candidatus Peregrinibacteria bacterium]|nr:MAG: hypothetical protein IPJ72_01720 [Candidatus Peregrinibacteria bacterium]
MQEVYLHIHGLVRTKNAQQPIVWHDEVIVRLIDEYKIKINKKAGFKIATNHDHPVYQAVSVLQKKQSGKRGVWIEIKKNIPPASGLSSQWNLAVAVMRWLNAAWNLNLSDEELTQLGANIDPKCAELLKQAPHYPTVIEGILLIVKPKYIQYPPSFTRQEILRHFPDIKSLMAAMRASGAKQSDIVGNGPALFAQFTTQKNAEDALKQIESKVAGSWIGKTSNELYEFL